jgi:hypothetical protein
VELAEIARADGQPALHRGPSSNSTFFDRIHGVTSASKALK